MTHNYGWKQPISTNLDHVFGDNTMAKWIYILLLLRARNSEEEKEFAGALHFLKRGQCVCGRADIAKEFRIGEQIVRSQLKKLEKVYNKITIETTPKGTVVTILNYDEVVSFNQQFNQQATNRQPTGNQQATTNKSDKSVENVKIDNISENKINSEKPEDKPTKKKDKVSQTKRIARLSDDEELKEAVKHYNLTYSKRMLPLAELDTNFRYWRGVYSVEQINEAISKAYHDPYWKEIITPEILFRRKNVRDEEVNRIDEFLGMKEVIELTPMDQFILEELKVTDPQKYKDFMDRHIVKVKNNG